MPNTAIESRWTNNEWVTTERAVEPLHSCELPTKFDKKAVTGARWQCPDCGLSKVLDRRDGQDRWFNGDKITPRSAETPVLPRSNPQQRVDTTHNCVLPTVTDAHGNGSLSECACGKTWRLDRRGDVAHFVRANSENKTNSNS